MTTIKQNLTLAQIHMMLALQNQINSEVDKDWVNLDRDWSLAILMEATEAIGHHGWKWWKKQAPDMDQLQMELVDIWHFILSIGISSHLDSEFIAENIHNIMSSPSGFITFDNSEFHLAEMDLVSKSKLLIGLCCSKSISIYAIIKLFASICESADLSNQELYSKYVAKNVLNMFRQSHGYKEGTYIKIWAGEEDNVHLTRIMQTEDIDSYSYIDNVMDKLVLAYTELN